MLLPGALRVLGMAHRAQRTLRAGTVLRAEDAETVRDWVPPSALCDREIEGTFLVNGVGSGRWLPCADLREPPLVRRGEELVVVYRAPGLELRGRGVARKDGWMGERLSVRVGGAERDCQAEVIGPGAVQVGAREPETRESEDR
jgi:flagella basal body P-ring formation protein FlgA